MRFDEIVEVSQDFRAAVNLEYDLNNLSIIRSYIPTEQSVRVLGEFLRPFYYSSESQNRASVLIGPYGRGKSHLFLVLSAITSLDLYVGEGSCREEAKQVLAELCEKIARVNEEVGALAKLIVEKRIRTLPVIINSNSEDINQAFLVAISDALGRANLKNLLPDTYFDAALAVIDKWNAGYPEAIAKLKEELSRKKESLEDLVLELKQYNQKAYRLFCNIYPQIAAGTEFAPLTNMDVVKLYISVSNALLSQTEYSGVSVVFDEFSKFLESNVEKSKMLSFKIIQDMAEAAARSKDAQLHFTCITHKEILDYSSSDSFKAVEGRFRKVRFIESSEQSYELIANAIIKNPSYKRFSEENTELFREVGNRSAIAGVFAELSPSIFERVIVKGCFPISPLSAFALLHVSELVGQNERTLFTFLAQDTENSFKSYLKRDVSLSQLITIDAIYDYFEDAFRGEVFSPRVHSIWKKTNAAVRQSTDDIQVHILKAIAIINIIDDEKLRPVPAHIKATLLMSDEVFDSAVKGLLKAHIVSQRDSSEFVLLTANGVDVQKSVQQYVDTSLTKFNACEVLKKAYDLGFVIPRAYNDLFSMLRCFRKVFIEAGLFLSYKNANQLLIDYPYDGVVLYLVCRNESQKDLAVKKIKAFKETPQVILCVTSHTFDIEDLLKQYEAVLRLLEKCEDAHFAEELEVFGEDLQRRIQSAIITMYSAASIYSTFYSRGNSLSITKQVDLNHAVSQICEECYYKTPIINNEMVNKTILNTQNTKARDLVADWILSHAADIAIPCMDGAGPEVSIFKSVFKRTGLDRSTDVEDKGIVEVLRNIADFVRSSEQQRQSFSVLYNKLSSPPYGLRRGIIPLFIAYALRPFKENVILYFKEKEIELTAASLSNLNESPASYEILVETGTREKADYLDGLLELFSKYSNNDSISVNRIYVIVKSMQNWMRSLPEYSKKYKTYFSNGEKKPIPDSFAVIRNELLRFEINPRELVFETLPQAISETENLMECLAVITEAKNGLDTHLESFKTELVKKIIALFIPGYQGSLSGAIKSWYDKLPEYKRTYVYDTHANAVVSMAGAIDSYDDEALLRSMALSLVSISIEDWNDEVADTFISRLTEALVQINELKKIDHAAEQSGHISLSFEGVSVDKTFDTNQISALGKTALNNLKSVFEEYNEALEPNEQLAILVQLVSEIVK